MLEPLSLLPVAVAAYLIGSIPMGVLLSRLFRWDDPRTHGSGHTGALNVSRRAGRAGLIVVLLADFLKGLGAMLLATRLSPSPWAIPLAGVAAVAGHCWPVWLRFQGGMGLATGMGVVIVYAWPLVIVAGALLAVIRFLIVRHTPRATIIAALALIPVALFFRLSPPVFVLVAGACLLIAARHTIDWNRKYDSPSRFQSITHSDRSGR